MANLENVFQKYGKIYDGSAKMVNQLFKQAISYDDEETMKALIFPGSPVLSAKVTELFEESYLQYICACCEKPNLVIIQLLIDFGVNIDKQDSALGETALHIATYFDSSDFYRELKLNVLKLLLKNGANQEIKNKYDFLTPIQKSLFEGSLDVVEEFLTEEEKLPNAIEVDRTKRCRHLVKCLLPKRNSWNFSGTASANYSLLLHFLILENDVETFEYIANNTNFDVNALNSEGKSLLHVLVGKSGTTRFIRALINLGADLDVAIMFGHGINEDVDVNQTPLITAIQESQIENIHFLLDNGASMHKKQKIKKENNSPLHYAICMQNFEIVEKLLQMGADVNELTYHRSPLLLACGGVHSQKWPLYENGFGLTHIFTREDDIPNNFYDLPFSVQIVELLLDHGADIERKNVSNRTPLDQACRSGKLDIVELLLSRGAKINQGDVSTLHHAVRGENPAIVKLILEQGANVNHRCAPEKNVRALINNFVIPPPRTPLECALNFINQDSKCKQIIELLIEYGVNVNVAEPVRRETPLHLACHSNKKKNILTRNARSRPATVKSLLQNNADVNALDIKGMVPLYYALRNYSAMNNAMHVQKYSRRLKPDLLALIACIAKRKETREFVTDENLILLEDETVRPMYQECVNELRLMKKSICESSNFSFFFILFKDIECLGGALKNNKDISEALRDGQYKKKFPIYAGYLEKRLLEVKVRQPRVDLGIVLFQKYVNNIILVPLIVQILHLLNLADLNNFAKACYVDVT